jgi:methyl-accepting chemotaxis protein
VIQQNASAAEEMASTTEELTGQSEPLVSALSFFKTGEERSTHIHRAATHTASKPEPSAPAKPAKPAKSNGHDTSAEGMAMAKAGVALHLTDKHDALDSEFERY